MYPCLCGFNINLFSFSSDRKDFLIDKLTMWLFCNLLGFLFCKHTICLFIFFFWRQRYTVGIINEGENFTMICNWKKRHRKILWHWVMKSCNNEWFESYQKRTCNAICYDSSWCLLPNFTSVHRWTKQSAVWNVVWESIG